MAGLSCMALDGRGAAYTGGVPPIRIPEHHFSFPQAEDIQCPTEDKGRPLGRSDIAALCRERSLNQKEEKRRFLAERHSLGAQLEVLTSRRAKVNGTSRCAGTVAGGSTTLHGNAGGKDRECFALQCEFERAAPVAGLATNPPALVAAVMWDASVHIQDLTRPRDLGSQVLIPHASSSAASSDSNAHAFVDAAFVPAAPNHLGLVAGNTVDLWRFDDTCVYVATFDHKSCISSLDFHGQQGLMGSAGDDGALKIWDISQHVSQASNASILSSYPLRSLAEQTRAVDCSFLGRAQHLHFLVASAHLDGTVVVWDLRQSAPISTLEGTDAASCLDSHEGSHLLAAGCADGQLCAWDLRCWRRLFINLDTRPYVGSSSCPRSLAFSPCGSFLATGSVDGELLIFQLGRGCRAFKIAHHADTISALAWTDRPAWVEPATGINSSMLVCASLDGSWSCWAHSGCDFIEDC